MAEAKYLTSARFDEFMKMEDDHHTRQEADVKKNAEELAKMRRTLYGNGVPGWDEMLRNVMTWIDEQKKLQEEAKKKAADDRQWLQRLVVGFFITNVLTWIAAAAVLSVVKK